MLFHISETSRKAPEAGASTKDNVGGSPSLEDCPPPSPLELVHETCLTRSAQVALVCVALLGHHRAPSKQFLEAAEAVTPQLCS